MTQRPNKSRVPVIPAIQQAMMHDPRVAAAQAAMQAGSSTAPVQGMYDGLARALQGGLGGIMNRRYNMQYLRDQDKYMDDTRAAYHNISGGASTVAPIPGIPPTAHPTPLPPAPPVSPLPPPPPPVQQQPLPTSPLPPANPLPPAPVMNTPGPAQVPTLPGPGPGSILDQPITANQNEDPANLHIPGSGVPVPLPPIGGTPIPPPVMNPNPPPGPQGGLNYDTPITANQNGNEPGPPPRTGQQPPLSDLATLLAQLPPDAGLPAQPPMGTKAPQPTSNLPPPPALPLPPVQQPNMPDSPRLQLDQPISQDTGSMSDGGIPSISRPTYVPPTPMASAPMPGSNLPPPTAAPPMPGSMPMTPNLSGGGPALNSSLLNPGMPTAPGIPQAPDSARRRLGSALMDGGNPYSFNMGVEAYNAGLDEDAHNQAEQRQRQFAVDTARYETGLNDYGSARNAARGATYEQQSDQRRFAHSDVREERGYQHADQSQQREFEQALRLQENQQGFTASQADRQRAYEGWTFRSQILGAEAPGGPEQYNVDQPGRFNVGGWTVGDGYGASRGGGARIHQGQDTFAPAGTPFPVGAPIRVIESHRQTSGTGDGGNIATVEFPDGSQWMAMHLPNLPAPGRYAVGSDILRAGTTGNAHGGAAHIHWQPANDLAHETYRQGRAATMSFLTGQPINAAATGAPQGRQVNIGPGAPGRPLPQRIESDITAAAQTTDQVLNLTSRFNDGYVGYMSDTLGNAALGVERRMPGQSDRVDWWADYNNMNNAVRHALFGSALTATEQAQWERSTITPGTSAPVARHMLETQNRLLQSALIRRARGSAAAGYNGGQIYELIGPDLVQRMAQPSGVRPGTEPGPDGATPPIRVNDNTYARDQNGRWTVVQSSAPNRGGMLGTGAMGRPGTRPNPRRFNGPFVNGNPNPNAQMPQQRPWFMRGTP